MLYTARSPYHKFVLLHLAFMSQCVGSEKNMTKIMFIFFVIFVVKLSAFFKMFNTTSILEFFYYKYILKVISRVFVTKLQFFIKKKNITIFSKLSHSNLFYQLCEE